MTISLTRRELLLGAAASLASRLAFAQGGGGWPARPVKVIVPGGE